jgi:hypothetical protein
LAFLDRLFEGAPNPYTLDLYPWLYLKDLCRRTYSNYKQHAYPHLGGRDDEVVKLRLNKYSFRNIGVNETLFDNVPPYDKLNYFLPANVFFVWDFEFDYAQKRLIENVELEKTVPEDRK